MQEEHAPHEDAPDGPVRPEEAPGAPQMPQDPFDGFLQALRGPQAQDGRDEGLTGLPFLATIMPDGSRQALPVDQVPDDVLQGMVADLAAQGAPLALIQAIQEGAETGSVSGPTLQALHAAMSSGGEDPREGDRAAHRAAALLDEASALADDLFPADPRLGRAIVAIARLGGQDRPVGAERLAALDEASGLLLRQLVSEKVPDEDSSRQAAAARFAVHRAAHALDARSSFRDEEFGPGSDDRAVPQYCPPTIASEPQGLELDALQQQVAALLEHPELALAAGEAIERAVRLVGAARCQQAAHALLPFGADAEAARIVDLLIESHSEQEAIAEEMLFSPAREGVAVPGPDQLVAVVAAIAARPSDMHPLELLRSVRLIGESRWDEAAAHLAPLSGGAPVLRGVLACLVAHADESAV